MVVRLDICILGFISIYYSMENLVINKGVAQVAQIIFFLVKVPEMNPLLMLCKYYVHSMKAIYHTTTQSHPFIPDNDDMSVCVVLMDR